MSHTKTKSRRISKAANSLQEECIRVPKVYDWVTDTLTVSKQIEFTHEQRRKIEEAMEDPSRRPLRIACETPDVPPLFSLKKHYDDCGDDFLCEQVGEKRDVTVPLNGEFVDAQLVDLLFTADIKVVVVDRHGCEVVDISSNASVFESFVLCFPDGTELMCDISKILCRIPSGTVLLNSPSPSSFTLDVTFCIDIQVEAEVKLEVLAKFCSPRENNITAPAIDEQCPPIEFPQQCPDIFPRPNCDCSASGEASGTTGEEATEQGRAGLDISICPNCSLTGSSLAFTFDDTDTEDGLKDFTFTARNFDQETLDCSKCRGGLKLMISGSGTTDSGEQLDFNLAVIDSKFGDQFQIELIDDESGDVEFDSGPVNVTEGDLTVQNCVTFD
ncbi:MAG TPA: hypothetical protein VF149_04445 [Bacillales bacterium]